MVLSVVSMMMFNLVDAYFVGQIGKLELAAISLTFPVILIIGSIAHGLGIGVSALISRTYGEGNLDMLKMLMTDSLSIGLIIIAIFLPLGLLTIEPVFKTLGATKETLPLVKQYMTIWYIGVIFVIGPFPVMGIAGAALATVIARAITLIACLWILLFRKKIFKIRHKRANEIFRNWKAILHIGLQNARSRMIIPRSVEAPIKVLLASR